MHITFNLLIIGLEIALLTIGAERFIYGAISLAKRLRWPEFISGVLLLALGTSLPELVVAIMAVGHKHSNLAIGGVVGSNISNILIVVGVVALIRPIIIQGLIRRQTLVQAVLLLIITGIFTACIEYTGSINRPLGIALFIGLFGYMFLLWRQLQQEKLPSRNTITQQTITAHTPSAETAVAHSHLADETAADISIFLATIYWILGLVVLLVSSHFLVTSIIALGKKTGISESVLGLTVVALGTSLPELASSIVSAKNNKHAMVLGNVLGSNCFNLLAVAAVPAYFAAGPVHHLLKIRDLPIMLVTTLLLMLCLMFCKPSADARQTQIGRIIGSLFVLAYILYLVILVV